MNRLFEKKILAELLNVPKGHVKYASGYHIPPDGYANTYTAQNKYYEVVVFLGSSDTEKIMEINNITFLIEIHK